MFSFTNFSHKISYKLAVSQKTSHFMTKRVSNGWHRKDLEFCQPALLTLKELKEFNETKKELENFNLKILKAREQKGVHSSVQHFFNESAPKVDKE